MIKTSVYQLAQI